MRGGSSDFLEGSTFLGRAPSLLKDQKEIACCFCPMNGEAEGELHFRSLTTNGWTKVFRKFFQAFVRPFCLRDESFLGAFTGQKTEGQKFQWVLLSIYLDNSLERSSMTRCFHPTMTNSNNCARFSEHKKHMAGLFNSMVLFWRPLLSLNPLVAMWAGKDKQKLTCFFF